MPKYFLVLIFFIMNGRVFSQELIPNGDFEIYSTCPVQFAQLSRATPWINPSIAGQTNAASPDVFNSCDTSNTAGVPINLVGYQLAFNGNGYAGIALWSPAGGLQNFREYLESPLDTVLTANACYHFRMRVNLANNMRYTTSSVGAYFSDTAIINIPNNYVLPFSSQINNTPGNDFDTLNWTLVEGNYTAHGGEQFILIGNFNDDANTSTHVVNSGLSSDYAYVYLDSVSLKPCTTGISDLQQELSIKVFPNPFDQSISCSLKLYEPVELQVYDLSSRLILKQEFSHSTNINTGSLAQGMYLYQVKRNGRILASGKIVKQ